MITIIITIIPLLWVLNLLFPMPGMFFFLLCIRLTPTHLSNFSIQINDLLKSYFLAPINYAYSLGFLS